MILMQLIHLTQVALAGYGALHSYGAITNLRTYESTAEKAARYSNEAERQLHETRTTQGAGAAALAASLGAALHLLLNGSAFQGGLRAAVMMAVVAAARAHGRGFWGPPRGEGRTAGEKVPLPKMGRYNEAQSHTEEILKVLDWTTYSWIVAAMVGIFRGY
ncbi:hypothetical protein DL764_007151 [Monosporascus ibericus]|uniref:DUF1772 domain-containing protein n=1 Tax=Monosporascus ibericus TaxID=155417 RepID=A0A4Q4T609_9PEZI|nr:hypothetical protein DL764_007151 [Monosporascus ibericus]